MYHDFYRFKDNPFNVTADPEFFFSSKSHSEAISTLTYGIEERKGIMILTGEVGTGKTTLCRKLIKHTNKKTRCALILNSNLSEVELLQAIVHDLGIRNRDQTKYGLMLSLNKFLLKAANKNHNVVLIIDEAQNLSITQLEQVRMLSNLETEKNKLLQIILSGQPELTDKLKLAELRQLRQRIAVHYHISPLDKMDIRDYIYHRMEKVMRERHSSRHITFTDQAIQLLYHYTLGSPRTINILCDRALLAGFVAETFSIDERIIEHCAKEILCYEHYL